MGASATSSGDALDLRIGNSEFRAIAQLVQQESGIVLSEAKRGLVVSRLARRLRDLGMTDFGTYCQFVESRNGAVERVNLISALTTNVTRFFRENHHFQALEQQILLALVERARKGGRVRIWSAGCSTGEEPYSIAMLVLELCPEAPKLDLRILATDIDEQVIATAEAGRYPEAALVGVSAKRRSRFFRSTADKAGRMVVSPDLRSLVAFSTLNLVGAWPMRGPFDIVFCRNVVIYFDTETQERLWGRFAGLMPPEGILFIGHSERLGRASERFFLTAGITQFRRTATPRPNADVSA